MTGRRRRDPDEIRGAVRAAYGRVAEGGGSGCGPSAGCCGGSADAAAASVGYAAEDLKDLPAGANMGLSCGNPTALAALRSGEVVLDLGAGGGLDVFIAAPKVGRRGRVIGVDMTPEMLAKARRNAEAFRLRTGLSNVEFRLGEIESLPVADASVDVVVSNCVVNLSPDKPRVWREIARALRPGGRVAVSDIALLRPLPAALRGDLEVLTGCIAGAVLVRETVSMMRRAGLTGVSCTAKEGFADLKGEGPDSLYRRSVEKLPRGRRPSDYVTSATFTAVKPGRARPLKKRP